ncbi:MAG TPA: lysylphosphatidylglycerol synthase domain-containing protein [Gemmatimonadaceae bacterium]|nr:lysylphosphatidylglycerol synthase domain-containing protein [Gemmatimonadaceae bacterium]
MSKDKITRYAFRAAQVVLLVAIVGFAVYALRTQWSKSSATLEQIHPSWGWVAISGVIFLSTYCVLLETWREVLRIWGARLDFVNAARIWTISNLGRYVPGKLWQIGAMAMMAEREQVSPIAATGSSILNVVVNLVAGFVVVAVLGWPLLDLPAIRGGRTLAIVFIVAGTAVLAALPRALPVLVQTLGRLTARDFKIGAFPAMAIVVSIIGNLIAWITYGAAFATFSRGIVGSSNGPLTAYIAVYALSYLVGYLVLFLPSGIGARELAMVVLLPAAHLADPAQAAVLAVTSRLWLTILEIAPGALFLTSDALRRRPREQ